MNKKNSKKKITQEKSQKKAKKYFMRKGVINKIKFI